MNVNMSSARLSDAIPGVVALCETDTTRNTMRSLALGFTLSGSISAKIADHLPVLLILLHKLSWQILCSLGPRYIADQAMVPGTPLGYRVCLL